MSNISLLELLDKSLLKTAIQKAVYNGVSTAKTEMTTEELSNLSNDLGIIFKGSFIATEGDVMPDDSSFTGCFMSGEGFTFNSETYHIAGILSGELQFGLNATTGKGVFAGGNAVIDIDGITGTDLLKWMIKQSATNSIYTRTGKLGMEIPPGSAIPAWMVSYESPIGSSVTIANGDFASTDYTSWTKTTETNGSWVEPSAVFYKQNTSGSSVNCVGILTSDREADITGNQSYLFGCDLMCRKTPIAVPAVYSAWGTAKIEVKWYDDASAGSLIETNTIYNGQSLGWVYPSVVITAPSAALSFEIVATLPSTALANNYIGGFYIDDFTMSEVSVNQKLWLADTGIGCSNGLYSRNFHGSGLEFRAYDTSGTENTAIEKTLVSDYSRSGAFATTNAEAASGDYFTQDVPLKSGTYKFIGQYRKSGARGKFDLYMDGTKYGDTIDMYAASASNDNEWTVTDIAVGYDGVHELKILNVGKHASASDYYFGMGLFTLYKTD